MGYSLEENLGDTQPIAPVLYLAASQCLSYRCSFHELWLHAHAVSQLELTAETICNAPAASYIISTIPDQGRHTGSWEHSGWIAYIQNVVVASKLGSVPVL